MIKFDENLLVGEDVKKRKLARIMRRLENGKVSPGVWIITNPTNEANVFDMFEAKLLIFSCYKKRETTVFAIAKSREKAEALLLELIEQKYGVSSDT